MYSPQTLKYVIKHRVIRRFIPKPIRNNVFQC